MAGAAGTGAERKLERLRTRMLALAGGDAPAALTGPGGGAALAVAVDTLVEGVHFLPGTAPEDVAYKAAAVNLSDLAAMGALPAGAGAVLEAPRWDEGLARALARGLREALSPHQAPVTYLRLLEGAARTTVQVFGWVDPDRALRRSGAAAGDAVYVTGTLGDAGAGLACRLGRSDLSGAARDHALARLNRPFARVDAGRALLGIASAAIDLSDGLASDLGHVLAASGVGATVELAALPVSEPLRSALGEHNCWRLAVAAGDDYELCVTVPGRNAARLQACIASLACPLTRIGRIEPEPGLRLLAPDGELLEGAGGHDHFGDGHFGE